MARKNRVGSVMTVMAAPALFATIAASYTAFWFYNVDSLKTGLQDFAKTYRQAGHNAKFTIDSTDGFPWNIQITLKNVNVSYQSNGTTWGIEAPEVHLTSGVFSPRSATAELLNETHLTQKTEDGTNAVTKTDGTAHITFETDSENTLRHINVTLENLQANGTWNGREMSTPLKVENGISDLRINPNAGQGDDENAPYASLTMDIKKWQWPSNARYTLGSELDSFNLSAKMFGVLDRKIDLQQALTLWREDGGKISVGRVAMTWGKSKLGGYGTMVLDDNLQPAANVTTQVKGFTNIVNLLDQMGLIRPKDATMARVVIGRQLPRSGTGNLSLSLRDGVVYAGPLAITKVPLIAWTNTTDYKGNALLQPGFDIGPDGQITRKNQ